MYSLSNKKLNVNFSFDETGLKIESVANFLSQKTVNFSQASMSLIIGGSQSRIINQEVMKASVNPCLDENSICSEIVFEELPLRINFIYRLFDFTLQMRVIIYNEGKESIFLKDLIMLQSKVDGSIEMERNEFDPSKGDPGMLQMDILKRVDAHPVFIDRHVFCGIDWPVAQNAGMLNEILCRQFCGEMLEPNSSFKSQTLTIGVSESGKLPDAFLKHLELLRGRKTKRASFYFDWLTHASEGPREEEVEKQLAFFKMLKNEFDIKYDIYAVDDGAVETRWGLTFDLYRMQHDCLFPSGLKRLTEHAKELGMDFGIWIGPDGFGNSVQKRIDDIVNIVKEWNVALIKMDVCVSVPLGNNPYKNEQYMRNLQRLCTACREIRPDLIIINHRITTSPYILAILDSTLWMGAESYPDVFLYNDDKPRLFTRYASYGRGEPTYYGTYSQLLEDHGVCFNGDYNGWKEEFLVQAFGRALMLSPEIYGTLFLLPDSEYPDLGRLTRLAKDKQNLLCNTQYLKDTGDFLHTDGTSSLVCLINDSWEVKEKSLVIDETLGLNEAIQDYILVRHFPLLNDKCKNMWKIQKGEQVTVVMRPFAVCVVEVLPQHEECIKADYTAVPSLSGKPICTLSEEIIYNSGMPLGLFEKVKALPRDIERTEKTRFLLSNDPTEAQAITNLPVSNFNEVNVCREFFYNKLRYECYGIAANAWDGDTATAWSDEPFWRYANNIWRLDMGELHKIGRIEVTLSDIGPGSVIDNGKGRKLEQPVVFEVSADSYNWYKSNAILYYCRQGLPRDYVSKLIAEFKVQQPVRYIRMHIKGIMVGDITIKKAEDSNLVTVGRQKWHGNNLFTGRYPEYIFSKEFSINELYNKRFLAITVKIPENQKVPLKQEVAVAWIEDKAKNFWPLLNASPTFPFHGWECNSNRHGNSWTFWGLISDDMVNKQLTAKLAWLGPEVSNCSNINNIIPDVNGFLLILD